MHAPTTDVLRQQLEDRRSRLAGAIQTTGSDEQLVLLLRQVDSALSQLGTDDYGLCLVCKEHVSEQDLLGNPLLRYCLCDLTPEQLRTLENDLELARRIQGALLPDPVLHAPGWETYYRYEPAGPVSGDYCDLWTHADDDRTLYFAVGDVSGKGVAASLLMSHLQAAFRSLAGVGLPLAQLVHRVNRQLLQATLPSHYATLVVGRANADGSVELVNAGHCPPLIVRRSEVESLGATGFPLGLLDDRPYEVDQLRLREGESLVLYTDGLTEARGADGDEFGQERVEQLLRSQRGAAPKTLVQAMRGGLASFLGESRRTDDLTMLVLSRANGRVS
ncbi:MAG: SpoIIE family protein phosphatase [Candidatus Eiseniibacteriota bacterium]